MQPCKVIRLLLLVCISLVSFVHSEPLGLRSAEQTLIHLTSDRLVGNHRIRRDAIVTSTNYNNKLNNNSSTFGATADPNAYLKDDSHAGHAAPFASPVRKPKHSDDASGDEEEDFNNDDDKPMDDEDDETDPENEDDEEDDLNEDANDNEELDKNGPGGSTSLKDNFEEDTDDEANEKPTSKNDPIGPSHADFEGSGEGEDDEKEDDDDDDKLDADEDENENPAFSSNNNNDNNKFNFDTNHGSSSNIKPESTLPTHSLSNNDKKPDHLEGDRTHLYSSENDFNRPKAPQPEEDDEDEDADKSDKDDDKEDDERHKPIVPPKITETVNNFDNHEHNNNNRIDDARSDPPTWSSRPDWTSETVSPPSRPSDTSNDNSILLFGRHNWSNTVSLFAQPTILAVIIVSAVLGLLVSIFLVMCIIYRMISKDEDCYEATKTQIHTTYGRANHKDRYP